MRLAYNYKLKPSKPQQAVINAWLELCRRQYNYRLGQRFAWYESTRSPVNACPLVVSIQPVERIYHDIPLQRTLTKGRKKGEVVSNIEKGYIDWLTVQRGDLKNTKQLLPEYEQIDAQVLQNVVCRVENTFHRFTHPDKNGNRSGRPRFRGRHYYNSFTYPQLSNLDITKDERGRDCINLKKIGLVPLVLHRPIPPGFKVKTGTIVREIDGFYVSLTLEAEDVPVTTVEIQPTEENSAGIDLGLEHYITLSTGETVEFPRWLRQELGRLKRLQRKLAKHPKLSKVWCAIKRKIAKLHRYIRRKRLDWQFKLAYQLLEKWDVLFVEDLSVKNMMGRAKPQIDLKGNWLPNGQSAKSGLNLSLSDAAFYQFVQVLKWVAFKLGKRIITVDPWGTSQYCHNCLNKVAKTLKDRWHECSGCGESVPRDENSAKLIKKLGLGIIPGLRTRSQHCNA